MGDVLNFNFNIPKIKRQDTKDNLRSVTVKGRDAQDLLDIAQRSFLDRNYRPGWEVLSVHHVENKTLEDAYRTKKAEMKEDGRHSRELAEQYAFLMMKDSKIVQKVAQDGLKTREMSFNSLGNSNCGVYLCKHADVQLRLFDNNWGQDTYQLMLFKVTLGKTKSMNVQPTMNVEPTPNYDCHISQLKPSPTDTVGVQVNRSQIYLYEYDDDCEPVKRPRHCLPYAVITYKKAKDASQSTPVGSNVNRYSRPVKISETSTISNETAIPVINRSKDSTSAKPSTVPYSKEPARQLTKQERRELFERKHAETLRRQNLLDNKQTSDLNDPKTYNVAASYSKTQTRQDPRIKNAPFQPPSTVNVVKQKSPAHGIDHRRMSGEKHHPGIGYQKQLSVNIPRQRYISGGSTGSPSPDGDSSISDALTDLIVKNQIKVDASGRPVLPTPYQYRTEEESINQKFADEIQKHLQMSGTLDVTTNKLQEDYTPTPMEIESSENIDSKVEKNEELEFDSKISELLNEASMKPIEQIEMKMSKDTESYKEINKKESDISKEAQIQADEQTAKVVRKPEQPIPKVVKKREQPTDIHEKDDEDSDDEKLIIAEMDVENKKLEEIEKRKRNKESSLERDLLTFVSREDIKKKDVEKGLELDTENMDSNKTSKTDKSEIIDIVVVREETMNKSEQMKMQREKVLKEVQSMLEKSKEKSFDKTAESKFENDNLKTERKLEKTVEIGLASEQNSEKKKAVSPEKEHWGTSADLDFEMSKFSSDSDSGRSDDEGPSLPESQRCPQNQPFDPRGPYDVQTSPPMIESRSDTIVSRSRELYNAYFDQNEACNADRRNDPIPQAWSQSVNQNFYREPVVQPQMPIRPTITPQHHEQLPYPPGRPDNMQNHPPRFPDHSRSDSDLAYHNFQQHLNQIPGHPGQHPQNVQSRSGQRPQNVQGQSGQHPQNVQGYYGQNIRGHLHQNVQGHHPHMSPGHPNIQTHASGPVVQDIDYRHRPSERSAMDFLNIPDMDYRQKSLIDVNPETLDVDYRRLNPVKHVNNQPPHHPDMRSQFQQGNNHPHRNTVFGSPPFNINNPSQPPARHYSPMVSNQQCPSNNSNMLSPPGSWGKTETIGLTSPSKEKKISFKDYKARRKNSPIRSESQQDSDGSYSNVLQTADIDFKNLKNILETVNVVSALKKDIGDSEGPNSFDKTQQYIDDVTQLNSEGEVKHTGKLSFLNNMKDDDGLFNCYGGEAIPGLDNISTKNISTGEISISSILGTKIDMKNFEKKDLEDPQQMVVTDEHSTSIKVNIESCEADHETCSLDTGSGKMTPPSSCSSPRVRQTKKKPNKDMVGYVKRRRRKRGKKNLLDNVSDITGDTGSVASSDWKSSVEDLSRGRVMTLEEVGLNHWTDAINHPNFQPRVVLKRQKQAELDAAEIAEQNELRSEKEALDSQPEQKHSMVRQWVETSHKKIKLITLKRTKDVDSESVKSGKSDIVDDVIDIDCLVEKQIARDIADDVVLIPSVCDIVYQKPGPKCSKKTQQVITQQSIPVLNKRNSVSSDKQQNDTTHVQTIVSQTQPLSQGQGFQGVSQGHIQGPVPPYPVTLPPPSVHTTTYPPQSHGPPYPIHGQIPVSGHSPQNQSQPYQYPPSSMSNQGKQPNLPYPVQSVISHYPQQPPPLSFQQASPSIHPGQQHHQIGFDPRISDTSHSSQSIHPQSSGLQPYTVQTNSNKQAGVLSSTGHLASSSTTLSTLQPQQSTTSIIHQPLTISSQNPQLPDTRNPPPHLHPNMSQHRAITPQIRPIVAQASFLNRPRLSLYPSQTIGTIAQDFQKTGAPYQTMAKTTPITSQPTQTTCQTLTNVIQSPILVGHGQHNVITSQTQTSTVTVSSTSTEGSTPTNTRRPSDLADWFADKLNPKSTAESAKDKDEKLPDKVMSKPKEGSLREELEKLRQSKVEEKTVGFKRKSRSPEKSPRSKYKRNRKNSSDYSSDRIEDSESDSVDSRSKYSRSSYSPSSRGSSRKRSPAYRRRHRYASSEYRRKISYSPFMNRSPGRSRSRSFSRSRSRSSSQTKKIDRKSPPARYRSGSADFRSRSSNNKRRSSFSPDNRRRRSPNFSRSKRRSSDSPDQSRTRRSPSFHQATRRHSNSPDRRRSPRRRSSFSPGSKRGRRLSRSPEHRRCRHSPESSRMRKVESRKRQNISPRYKSGSPKKSTNTVTLPKAVDLKQSVEVPKDLKDNVADKEKKVPNDKTEEPQKTVEEAKVKSSREESNDKQVIETDRNKWTKSNFKVYTVEQINEEDRKLQEELKNLEELKKKLEKEDEKMKEEERKKEDERIRKELLELEKQKKIAEELLELQKEKQLAEELKELERQKKLAEELIELEKQRKIAEELVELEKKNKTAEEMEELDKRKRELENEIEKPISLDEENIELENDAIFMENDKKISDELDELAQQKEELQKALAALESTEKEADVCEIDSSGLEDGEIEDDSEEEITSKDSIKGDKKDTSTAVGSVIDLTWTSPKRKRRSISNERRRRRSVSVGSDYDDDGYNINSRPSQKHSDEDRRHHAREFVRDEGRRQHVKDIGIDEGRRHHVKEITTDEGRRHHAKEIGSAWGAMLSHNDTRVERIKGDPFFKQKKEVIEPEEPVNEFVKTKPKSLAAKIRSSELITAYDLVECEQKSKAKPELVTFADWLKMEYTIDETEIGKYQKFITCVEINTRIDMYSKNKRKSLKKRLRAEMQKAQEQLQKDENMKFISMTGCVAPARSVVISGIKERLESEKDGDKRIVCDSGLHQLSEIERLQEPFSISRQELVSELETVRSALKNSWKMPKGKAADAVKNESSGFGEGDYDHEFLMRHDLQQLEAEILMRINHFEFHGVPNRRVPEILLTKKEKTDHFSQEGLFLVLTASISHKAYQNLLSLKKKVESTELLVSTLNPTTHGPQILKHLQEIDVLHQSRKAVMLTIAGYLTKKRFSKLATRLKYYKRCVQYMKDLWDTELVYLTTTVSDVEVHLKLGERLLHEQDSGKIKPYASSILSDFDVLSLNKPGKGNQRNTISSSSTITLSQVEASHNAGKSDLHLDHRNVQLKGSEYVSRYQSSIPTHTSQSSQRTQASNTQTSTGSSSGNLRQIQTTKSQNSGQSMQQSKLVDQKFQRQNSRENKDDKAMTGPSQNSQLPRGQNVTDDRFNQNNRYGTIDSRSDNKQTNALRGESASISSPYTLPPARYLQQPQWTPRGQIPQSQNPKSENDVKLESDLMTVRDKLLHLSTQLRHDDSVRMSVESVLLSVTQALNLMREESSNLPKVKDIILECLSRYNAVKELMEG